MKVRRSRAEDQVKALGHQWPDMVKILNILTRITEGH